VATTKDSTDERHVLHIQGKRLCDGKLVQTDHDADDIAAWLSALIGAEHLSVLVGSGLGVALAAAAEVDPLDMSAVVFGSDRDEQIDAYASQSAKAAGRGEANVEDQFRAALQALAGLQVIAPTSSMLRNLDVAINREFKSFADAVLEMETDLLGQIEDGESPGGAEVERILVNLLLGLNGRPPSRERLHVFTTNYDRLIEFGADLAGLRIIDRFVGAIEPEFRSSRVEVDLHYNPPGIRGEPRYLEGVFRLSKLHGSIDWNFKNRRLRRSPLAFGAETIGVVETEATDRIIIYPNAAKDMETLEFPYAELFRDFAAALCRPNGVLMAIGYGFGDDHINRVIRDMLTLSSTHLVVISYSDPGGRIDRFVANLNPRQFTLLIGTHFGALAALANDYLPQAGYEAVARRDTSHRAATGLGSAPNPAADTHA
jgi:hypothetical protein